MRPFANPWENNMEGVALIIIVVTSSVYMQIPSLDKLGTLDSAGSASTSTTLSSLSSTSSASFVFRVIILCFFLVGLLMFLMWIVKELYQRCWLRRCGALSHGHNDSSPLHDHDHDSAMASSISKQYKDLVSGSSIQVDL
jgi:hypothetical protein